jgi:hypothetical protein
MVRSIWMKSAQTGLPCLQRTYGPIFHAPTVQMSSTWGFGSQHSPQAQQKSRQQFDTEVKAIASDDSCPGLRYDDFGTWSRTGGDSEAQVILRTISARRSHGDPAPRTGPHGPPEALARTMRKDPKTPRPPARALASSRLT